MSQTKYKGTRDELNTLIAEAQLSDQAAATAVAHFDATPPENRAALLDTLTARFESRGSTSPMNKAMETPTSGPVAKLKKPGKPTKPGKSAADDALVTDGTAGE